MFFAVLIFVVMLLLKVRSIDEICTGKWKKQKKKVKFLCVRNTPKLKCFESFHDDYGKVAFARFTACTHG